MNGQGVHLGTAFASWKTDDSAMNTRRRFIAQISGTAHFDAETCVAVEADATVSISFVDVFDKHWKKFSAAWEKVRHCRDGCAVENVHELRVSDRRLVAILDIGLAQQHSNSISHLRERCMKILKCLGPLRDLQVEFIEMRAFKSIKETHSFRKYLKRAEKKEVQRVLYKLRLRKKALKSGVRHVRETAKISLSGARKLIEKRSRHFTQAWKNIDPSDGASLHAARIALKDFRYTLEAAMELFQCDFGKHTETMQADQKRMGDLRDSERLSMRLQRWSEKHGDSDEGPVHSILNNMTRRQRRLRASFKAAA